MNISNTILYTLLTVSVITGILIQMIGNIRGAYLTIPIAVYLLLKTTPYRGKILEKISMGFHGGVFGAIALASLPWIDPLLGGINGGLFTEFVAFMYLAPIGFIAGMIFGFFITFLYKQQ